MKKTQKTQKTQRIRSPKPNMWDKKESSVKSISLGNEKRLSEEVGFELTPGSGNQPWASKKGDGTHPLFLFECKETQKRNISIGTQAIAKINREAKTVGKEPVLILSAYGLPEPLPQEWACVPVSVFEPMLRAYEKSEEVGD